MSRVIEVVLAVAAGILWGIALFVAYVARVPASQLTWLALVILPGLGTSVPILLLKFSRRIRRPPLFDDLLLLVVDSIIGAVIALGVIVGLILQNLRIE